VNFEPWYKNPSIDKNQILSSRVRLARNLQNFPFHRKLTATDAADIVYDVEQTTRRMRKSRLDSQQLNSLEAQIFLEKHIISPKYIKTTLPKSILTDEHQNTSVMVNEEDHIRIQSIYPGDNLALALSDANKIDDMLEKHLDFSFDSKLGYLTTCPTNVGTGLRASFMVHLPCLDRLKLIEKLFPYITKSGLTLRGIYGEGTIPMGSIYQISNQATLGQKESHIIKNLAAVTGNIIRRENQLMNKILTSRRNYLEDRAYRAYGILANCRRIGVKEAMGFLSDIRMGFFAEILDMPRPDRHIYQIMMEIQPGHLCEYVGESMDEQETDIARAYFLREIFN